MKYNENIWLQTEPAQCPGPGERGLHTVNSIQKKKYVQRNGVKNLPPIIKHNRTQLKRECISKTNKIKRGDCILQTIIML